MGLWISLAIITVVFILMGRGVFRKYVDPGKIRWYDYFVLIGFCFMLFAIELLVIHLGGFGHIALVLGSGWYAVDVIDGRAMPKEAGKLRVGHHR